MYLHLGQDVVVRMRDVIGIFDLDTSTVSKETRRYLTKAEQEGWAVTVSTELPKSFVVCASPSSGRQLIYISQISSSTLLKRVERRAVPAPISRMKHG
nr:extracellular matrix/biofilm biosynthesis regulator RemA family protein [uncultured Solibaculum sp.]